MYPDFSEIFQLLQSSNSGAHPPLWEPLHSCGPSWLVWKPAESCVSVGCLPFRVEEAWHADGGPGATLGLAVRTADEAQTDLQEWKKWCSSSSIWEASPLHPPPPDPPPPYLLSAEFPSQPFIFLMIMYSFKIIAAIVICLLWQPNQHSYREREIQDHFPHE